MPTENLIKKTLSKNYRKEDCSQIDTLWQTLKAKGILESFDFPKKYYLKLGKSHYSVSLLKEINYFLSRGLINSFNAVWIPKKAVIPLIMDFNNDWALLICPCDVSKFQKDERERSGGGQ